MHRLLRLILPISLLSFLGVSAQAHAALDMYLKIDGIPGDSRATAAKDQIDVLAWSWGANRYQGADGHARNFNTARKPNLADITITKYIDGSSPLLYQALTTGAELPSALLRVIPPTTSTTTGPFELCIENFVVRSIQTGGSGGEDRMTENVSLAPMDVAEEYTPVNSSGTQLNPVLWGWSMVSNASIGFSDTCGGPPAGSSGSFNLGSTANP